MSLSLNVDAEIVWTKTETKTDEKSAVFNGFIVKIACQVYTTRSVCGVCWQQLPMFW